MMKSCLLLTGLILSFFSFAQNQDQVNRDVKFFAANAKALTDTTITIKVKGVTCGNDLKTLSNNVKQIKGVSDCTPGKAGPTSEFKITYDPALVNTNEIYKAIENTEGCSDPNDRPYKVKTN